MADSSTGSLPLTAASTPPAHGSNMGTVLGAMLKDGLGLAVVGALVGIAATAVLAVVLGPTQAFQLLGKYVFHFNAGGPIASTLCSGAALGALSGAAIGIPVGGLEGMHELHKEEANAETAVHKAAPSTREPSVTLERDDVESSKFRDMLAQGHGMALQGQSL